MKKKKESEQLKKTIVKARHRKTKQKKKERWVNVSDDWFISIQT